MSSAKTGNTVSYLYDHTGARVKKTDTVSGVPTYYVTPEYEVEGTVTRHHIVAPGVGSIASMLSYPTYDTTRYHLTDHLGGTHVEVDYLGNALQYMVYEPFGKVRYSWQSGSYSNDYKYTGKEQDSETSWQYYGARYYDNNRGQFMSADPVFLALGTDRRVLSNLRDPQIFNSYSYTRNNPYGYVDPSGEFLVPFLAAVAVVWNTVIDPVSFLISVHDYQKNPSISNGIGLALDGLALVTVAPGGSGLIRHSDDIVDAARAAGRFVRGVDAASGGIRVEARVVHTSNGVSTQIYSGTRDLTNALKDAEAGLLTGHQYKNLTLGSDGNPLLPTGGDYTSYSLRDTPNWNYEKNPHGPERIIVDRNTGSAWYTADHYGEAGQVPTQIR